MCCRQPRALCWGLLGVGVGVNESVRDAVREPIAGCGQPRRGGELALRDRAAAGSRSRRFTERHKGTRDRTMSVSAPTSLIERLRVAAGPGQHCARRQCPDRQQPERVVGRRQRARGPGVDLDNMQFGSAGFSGTLGRRSWHHASIAGDVRRFTVALSAFSSTLTTPPSPPPTSRSLTNPVTLQFDGARRRSTSRSQSGRCR